MLSSSCSSRPRGALWRYCTDGIVLQLCRAWGRSPGPPSRVEMHRKMEIALGTSSFAVWTEELMVVFRDCVDHVDYMHRWWTRGYKSFCTNACPPAYSFIQEYATEGLAGPTCQLRHVTWPNCMPRAHCQAFTSQSCLQLSWIFSSISFISDHLLPSTLNTPHALQEPPWQVDLQRSPTL